MSDSADGATEGESSERLEMRRRTLTRIAGAAGAGLFVGWSVDGVADTARADDVHITMNIQPIDDRVLVQHVESDETTDSGIIVPGNTEDEEEPQEGIVRATGDEVQWVTEGDTVIFPESSGTTVVIAGEDHLIVDEGELLAIIND